MLQEDIGFGRATDKQTNDLANATIAELCILLYALLLGMTGWMAVAIRYCNCSG